MGEIQIPFGVITVLEPILQILKMIWSTTFSASIRNQSLPLSQVPSALAAQKVMGFR